MKKVCGLDVHKDSIFCAIYNGENYSQVKEFSTMTPNIYSMGEYLQSEDVEDVAWKALVFTGSRYGICYTRWGSI